MFTDEVNVKNTSGLDLETLLTIDDPFYIINDQEEYVQTMNIVLLNEVEMKIRVFASPLIQLAKISKRFKGDLTLEYKQYPKKVQNCLILK